MNIILAKVKKKSRTKKVAKKTVASRRKKKVGSNSRRKKVSKKKTVKKITNLRFKIDKNNWIIFYYAAAYIGIFGLFALAIYYSN